MSDELFSFTMSYEEYFDAFDDICELRDAAKIWVKQDIDRLNKLQEENKLLRECVEFYADKNNWEVYNLAIKNDLKNGYCGEKARKTLAKIKGDENV